MRNIILATGAYYHVYNRGVDHRTICEDSFDYLQFQEFMGRSKHALTNGSHLVHIHAYSIMPNHIHFLLEQNCGNGIAIFMHRVSTSYTRYFNRRYRRTGSLFESTYKAKHVTNTAYLSVLAAYIHNNPRDIRGYKTIETLDRYPWSSYAHYRALLQNPLVDDNILSGLFGTPEATKNFHEAFRAPYLRTLRTSMLH